MFLAHLPAGYLCSHAILASCKNPPRNLRPYLALGMLGSIAPDLDFIWHAFLDPHPVFHHLYWTHYPFAWALPSSIALLVCLVLGQRNAALGVLLFAANGLLHLLLDTPWGSIAWAWPFDPTLMKWVSVPHNQRLWLLNFVFHWTALVELSIITAACALWLFRRRRAAQQAKPVAIIRRERMLSAEIGRRIAKQVARSCPRQID
ncbi:metal-dependent hydrolase [Stenotrophobium rhamnosiphilum]|uniref:Hydrolase n=1 Tax=Stenotrophobium rhamnosiphilum TaxID=2029166 RepID=A0A2T5MGF0_9GAMM|nr:metal-dependent hydrolase [Stenotrophobium rhamnosiphilum]PTU31654.1 hydrolase [Stenotrophobium rhamnosiphilum]